MPPLKALVVDDQFKNRERFYKELASENRDVLTLDPVELPFDIRQIEKLAGRSQLVLLDIFLNQDNPFEIAGQINVLERLGQARPQLPIFLVSDQWDKVSLEIYGSLVRNRQIAGGLTLQQLKDAAARQQIRMDIVKAVREAWGVADFDGGANADLCILHVSDLQCGGDWVQDEADRLVQDMVNALPRVDGIPRTPDILAVTGDIAERGEPREFQAGFRILEMLRERLSIPRQSCFIVPGNHDVSLPLSCSHLVSYRFGAPMELAKKERNPRLEPNEARGLDRFGLAPFQDFCRAFTGRNDWRLDYRLNLDPVTRPWFLSGLFAPFGLNILCLNTVALLGPEAPSRAALPQGTVTQLERELDELLAQQPEAEKLTHLVLLHHSPWAGIGKETLEDAEILMLQLAKRGDCIFLFGHIHEAVSHHRSFVDHAKDHPRQAVYAAASTPALSSKKRPEDTSRGFNWLRVERQDDTVVGLEIQQYERRRLDFRVVDEPLRFTREPSSKAGWSIRS